MQRTYYPNSFLKLILIGFTLVALPLVAALIYAAFSVDRLATQTQQAVYQAVQATQSSHMLIEQISAMERYARQFQVLGDPALLQGFAQTHGKFLVTTTTLSALSIDQTQRNELKQLINREASLYGALSSEKNGAGTGATGPTLDFDTLLNMAQSVLGGSNRMIDREIKAVQQAAGHAREILLWQALALIPIAVLLAAGFALLIARPIKQIESAIRKLGEGEFSMPINVTGPPDLENLGNRLEWLRSRLVELEREKNRFLRHVSHELKTPLTALREGTELLADEVSGKLNDQQYEIVTILQKNCLQLQTLIENLLNFSVAQLRHTALNLGTVQLSRIAQKVEEDQKLAIMAKSIKLEKHIGSVQIEADEEKLRVILDNLLSNAIKFSPPGGTIQLDIKTGADAATIEFHDEGPGIDMDERIKVFEPFNQGRAAEAGQKGTGLGLAIAREYVMAHNGEIVILNTPDKGAHLRVRLPLRRQTGFL